MEKQNPTEQIETATAAAEAMSQPPRGAALPIVRPLTRVGRIKSPEQVRRLQERILKHALHGGMSSGDAYRYTIALSLMLKSIEVADLDARIRALEQSTGSGTDTRNVFPLQKAQK